MSNLKLITTERFNNLSCNFYRNMNDDILLTREQIGQALEYTDPIKAIQKIHLKHQDRLEPLCMRIKGSTQIGGDLSKSEEQKRVYYTERGIMEICRWSRQKNANLFMDWTWDIISKYRHNELNTMSDTKPLIDAITTLTQAVTQLQKDVTSLKSQNKPSSPNSHWKTNTFDKLRIIIDYANTHSDQNLTLTDALRITINEMEDTYNINLTDYTKNYMLENSTETKPYVLDVINYYKDIRSMYTLIVDTIMDKLHLKAPSTRNIFDELAENIAS